MTRLWTVVIALVAGCTRAAVNDDTTSARDTTTVASTPYVPVAAVVVDSATGAVDPVIAPDSTIPIASSDELSILASRLIIPVQGIVATQLHDSYAAARAGHTHEALDIMAPRGTPVVSAIDGRVLKLHKSVAGGNMVYAADPSDRFILMYGHLDQYADGLADGQHLTRGQVLGYVGSTGDASPTAPHLHFAIARGRPSVEWWKGEPVNPFPLFVPSASSAVAALTRTDTAAALPRVDTVAAPAPAAQPAAKKLIEPTAKRAIAAIAAHDMAQLASLVHPTLGVRFSPYQYVDKKADRVLKKEQIKGLWTNRKISIWGTHDGSGEPLRLTYAEYHKAFIYDADFLHAPKVAFGGEPMGRGTTTNNIADVYPGAIVVEYHRPGTDPKAGGLDWKSLWLVFQKQGSTWYLVGIAHGAWTT